MIGFWGVLWAGPGPERAKLWVCAQEWEGRAKGGVSLGFVWGWGKDLKKPMVGGYGLWPDGRGCSKLGSLMIGVQWVHTKQELVLRQWKLSWEVMIHRDEEGAVGRTGAEVGRNC